MQYFNAIIDEPTRRMSEVPGRFSSCTHAKPAGNARFAALQKQNKLNAFKKTNTYLQSVVRSTTAGGRWLYEEERWYQFT